MILSCPLSLVVNEGDNVSCVCTEKGGSPPSNVTWFDENNIPVKGWNVGENKLMIENITLSQGGTYRCIAESYPSKNYKDEKSVEIKVNCKKNTFFKNCVVSLI